MEFRSPNVGLFLLKKKKKYTVRIYNVEKLLIRGDWA